MMPPSQDHKTRHSGNTGPNTGGMGAVCPYPVDAATSALCKDILQAAVDGMALDGVPFKGNDAQMGWDVAEQIILIK
jgi:phosphoribosylamine--glycine ligase